jgi:hypothetical protein
METVIGMLLFGIGGQIRNGPYKTALLYLLLLVVRQSKEKPLDTEGFFCFILAQCFVPFANSM